MRSKDERILEDCLVVEALSGEVGEPTSLRLTSKSGEGSVSEGSAQRAETLLVPHSAPAHAEGRSRRACKPKVSSTSGLPSDEGSLDVQAERSARILIFFNSH